MNCKLEFDLPEDQDSMTLALNGSKYWLCLWDLDNWLRGLLKYDETLGEENAKQYQEVRDKLREIMEDHGVSLEDVS